MRPVERQRKNVRRSAKKAVRREPRAVARTPERQSIGRRIQLSNDPVTRFFRRARSWLSFRRPMLTMTAALIVLAFLAALFAGGYVGRAINGVNTAFENVIADAGFGISSLHLAGNRRTPPKMILAALGFEPGQSIFAADLHAARARLMALDWVADAEVSRTYPDSISVSIVEKVPFALWQSQNGLYVVERSGRVIARADALNFPHLPLFVGDAPQGGADLVDAIAQHRAVVARVKAMQRVSGRRWNLVLDDGVVVKLPEDGWQKQLDTLEHLIVDKGVLERDISEIDLRAHDNYFFQLRNGQKQQAPRERAI
jgi:cell division protein FtsQ